MVKIVDNSGQYKLTIPKDIVVDKSWSSKTRIKFIEDINENIFLKPAEGKGIKIVNNSGQFKITIPKDIVEDKGWSSNTKLRFVENIGGNIILKEIKDKRK